MLARVLQTKHQNAVRRAQAFKVCAQVLVVSIILYNIIHTFMALHVAWLCKYIK